MSTKSNDCQRLERITLARIEGLDLSAEDRIFSEYHLEECADCRLVADTTAVLGDPEAADIERGDELARRRWLDRLLERDPEADLAPPARDARQWPRTVAAVAAGAALAAGLMLAGLWLMDDRPGREGSALAGDMPSRVLGASGEVRSELLALKPGDALRAGQSLTVGRGRLKARLSPGVTLALESDSALDLVRTGGMELAVRLERGRLLSTVDTLEPGQRYSVVTRFGEVVALGTVFEVGVTRERAEVQVVQGSVRLLEPGREERALRAGEHATLGTRAVATAALETPRTRHDAGPPRITPPAPASEPDTAALAGTPETPQLPATPQALLDQAREHRMARQWKQAARVYERLIAEFPQRSEAGTARVALGEIRLDQLDDAAGALRAFEQYLDRDPAGELAPEAAFGRARALRGLGRTDQERAALDDLLVRFPQAMQAAQARTRLDELEGSR